MFEYWSVNERVLMGHLRGMCENVGQAEQLYRSLVVEGGNYEQKQKQKNPPACMQFNEYQAYL